METSTPSKAAAPTPQAEAAPQHFVPETWPGAWGLYKHAKAVTQSNLGPLLTLFVLNLIIGGGTQRLNQGIQLGGTLIGFLLTLLSVVVYLAAVRGHRLSVGEALKKTSLMLYLKLLVCLVVICIALAFSLLLLIVPFFIIAPRLMLAPYILVDKNTGPLAAINESWVLTKGHVGKAWGIIGATIAMCLLIVTIIGIPFAFYFLFMYGAALVIFYEFINKHRPTASATPSVNTTTS